jgi:hypothetical protein
VSSNNGAVGALLGAICNGLRCAELSQGRARRTRQAVRPRPRRATCGLSMLAIPKAAAVAANKLSCVGVNSSPLSTDCNISRLTIADMAQLYDDMCPSVSTTPYPAHTCQRRRRSLPIQVSSGRRGYTPLFLPSRLHRSSSSVGVPSFLGRGLFYG